MLRSRLSTIHYSHHNFLFREKLQLIGCFVYALTSSRRSLLEPVPTAFVVSEATICFIKQICFYTSLTHIVHACMSEISKTCLSTLCDQQNFHFSEFDIWPIPTKSSSAIGYFCVQTMIVFVNIQLGLRKITRNADAQSSIAQWQSAGSECGRSRVQSQVTAFSLAQWYSAGFECGRSRVQSPVMHRVILKTL